MFVLKPVIFMKIELSDIGVDVTRIICVKSSGIIGLLSLRSFMAKR